MRSCMTHNRHSGVLGGREEATSKCTLGAVLLARNAGDMAIRPRKRCANPSRALAKPNLPPLSFQHLWPVSSVFPSTSFTLSSFLSQ